MSEASFSCVCGLCLSPIASASALGPGAVLSCGDFLCENCQQPSSSQCPVCGAEDVQRASLADPPQEVADLMLDVGAKLDLVVQAVKFQAMHYKAALERMHQRNVQERGVRQQLERTNKALSLENQQLKQKIQQLSTASSSLNAALDRNTNTPMVPQRQPGSSTFFWSNNSSRPSTPAQPLSTQGPADIWKQPRQPQVRPLSRPPTPLNTNIKPRNLPSTPIQAQTSGSSSSTPNDGALHKQAHIQSSSLLATYNNTRSPSRPPSPAQLGAMDSPKRAPTPSDISRHPIEQSHSPRQLNRPQTTPPRLRSPHLPMMGPESKRQRSALGSKTGLGLVTGHVSSSASRSLSSQSPTKDGFHTPQRPTQLPTRPATPR